VPWELFDISFELPCGFLLENTLFDIGSKLMVFRWKLRRFHLWHFSCADMFLKDDVIISEWLAAHINDARRIQGIVFSAGDDGSVVWQRRRRHLIAHRDELSRWCFKYDVRYRYDREKNQLIAWVFSYRRPEDLDIIPPSLRFEECPRASEKKSGPSSKGPLQTSTSEDVTS